MWFDFIIITSNSIEINQFFRMIFRHIALVMCTISHIQGRATATHKVQFTYMKIRESNINTLKSEKNANEPPHVKTNKMTCVPSKDSDQSGHPPSLIRVFAVRMKKAWVLGYPLNTQWSDWADAQADLSLHWAHSHFVGFVMWRLK